MLSQIFRHSLLVILKFYNFQFLFQYSNFIIEFYFFWAMYLYYLSTVYLHISSSFFFPFAVNWLIWNFLYFSCLVRFFKSSCTDTFYTLISQTFIFFFSRKFIESFAQKKKKKRKVWDISIFAWFFNIYIFF